jgi:hypothetical protein
MKPAVTAGRRRVLARKIWDFAAFQGAWFACVLGAAAGLWLLGPRVMLAVAVIHLLVTPRPLREGAFLLIAATLGTGLDAVLMALGCLSFDGGIWLAGLPPLWMTALWLGFATLFATTLDWLRERYLLAAVLGAVGGPLAYVGGARLGALELHPDTLLVAVAVAAEYAVATPLLLFLSRRLTGNGAVNRPTGDRATRVGAAEARPT